MVLPSNVLPVSRPRRDDLQGILNQGIVLELVYFQLASSVGIADG
jgi:hypothetical protein